LQPTPHSPLDPHRRHFKPDRAGCAHRRPAAGPHTSPEFVSIKGKTVNVREQPNTRSATLWELSKGYPLQVTQRKGQWLRVKDYESTLGWVHAPLTSKSPHMVVTARTANLRSGPGQKHKRVGKLEQHEVLQTLKKQGSWAQVQRSNGQSGWVAKNLVWGW
jgi:SH3-like domain-containing protein